MGTRRQLVALFVANSRDEAELGHAILVKRPMKSVASRNNNNNNSENWPTMTLASRSIVQPVCTAAMCIYESRLDSKIKPQ